MGCGGDPKATGNTNLSKELDSRGNNIFSILGSSSGYLGFNCRKVDNIVDLKLGSLIPNNNSTSWRGFPVHNSQMQPYSTSTTSSSSGGGGPSRRSRASGGGTQVASCLVDGCKSDLSKCRDYHRRHKVCELHSKTPRVTIGGMEQRFCQQCSRFHSLGEFDEGKRSCRKRLEGHNRRRRKPQPDALSVNPANFLSTGRGGRFLPFSSSPIIPAGSVVSSAAWSARPMKPESSSTTLYNTSHSQLNMYDGGNRCYNTNAYRGRQFPFLQGPDSSSSTPSTPNNITVSGGDHSNHGRVHHNLFCENNNNNNGLSGAQVIDSTDRALSLLSSSSSHAENAAAAAASAHTGIGLSRLIHPIDPHHQVHHHHHHHHLASASLNYNGMGHFPCSSPSSQVLDVAHHHSHGQGVGGSGPDPATAAGLNMSNTGFHCHDIFQAASEGSASSASGPHQTLSFSWE